MHCKIPAVASCSAFMAISHLWAAFSEEDSPHALTVLMGNGTRNNLSSFLLQRFYGELQISSSVSVTLQR